MGQDQYSTERPVYSRIHPKHLSPVKKTQSAILSSGNYKLHGARLVILIVAFSKQIPDFHKLLTKERSEKRDRMMEKKLIRFKKTNSEVEMSGNELIDMIRMTEFEKTNGVIATSGEEEDEDEEEKEEEKEKERNAHDLIVGKCKNGLNRTLNLFLDCKNLKQSLLAWRKTIVKFGKNSKITTVILKDSNICPQKS
ncbi:hypothetical protein BASA50_009249 [Batrachochytrium salamandrivorans]|uniref:Uncharacterized protein n=1 Tax=Batrachochytrium salamandrivorans TaxID=1357716 RepID=A0ABQ8F1Y7_9FUNG|nr:hypothetical protein BASA50_009249 [Batrachochytrium salamandrivorans]